jgi:hypothetical protein
MSGLTTWRREFEDERQVTHDDSPLIAVAPDESVLDEEFDSGYGSSEGPDVLLWTEQRVYFPVVYDGAEWLASAPRNPVAEGQKHVGGQ